MSFQESVWKKLTLMYGKVLCSKLHGRKISTSTQTETTLTEIKTEASWMNFNWYFLQENIFSYFLLYICQRKSLWHPSALRWVLVDLTLKRACVSAAKTNWKKTCYLIIDTWSKYTFSSSLEHRLRLNHVQFYTYMYSFARVHCMSIKVLFKGNLNI